MNKTIKDLVKKYKLNKIEKRRLNAEFEIIKLRTEFSVFKAKQGKLSLYKSLVKYGGIERFFQKLPKKQYQTLAKEKNLKAKEVNQKEINKIALDIFNKSDYRKEIIKHYIPSKCFTYGIWKNKGVAIHFWNAVAPKHPFKGKEYEKREQELRNIALEVKKKYPKAKYVFSISWMWNLRVFQSFMPDSFNKSIKEFEENLFYSGAHWGQFYRYTGSLNKKRVKQFKKNWKFPIKTVLGECPIKDFYDMCLPYRKNVSIIASKNNKFLLVNKHEWPKNWWKFPQGGLKEGESIKEGAKREFLEEAGTNKIKIIGISKFVNRFDWDNLEIVKIKKARGQEQKFVIAEFKGNLKDIKPDNEEIRKVRWVTSKELEGCSKKNKRLFDMYNGLIPKILKEFKFK